MAVGLGVLMSGPRRCCSATGGPRSARRAIPSGCCWCRSSSSSSPAAMPLVNRWARRWMDALRQPQPLDRRHASACGASCAGSSPRRWRWLILFLPIRLSLDASGYFTPRLLMVWNAVVTTICGTFFYLRAGAAGGGARPSPNGASSISMTARPRASPFWPALTALVATFNTQLGKIAEALYPAGQLHHRPVGAGGARCCSCLHQPHPAGRQEPGRPAGQGGPQALFHAGPPRSRPSSGC